MNDETLILIDPLVGFCKPEGSLGHMHGKGELEEIEESFPKIRNALGECARRHLVKSEYSVGQFSDGDNAHARTSLCVHGMNNDCEAISEFACCTICSTPPLFSLAVESSLTRSSKSHSP
jgi:hypothetical protein